MPIAREFQPDLVLVSAGFDAALGDMGAYSTVEVLYVYLFVV
jgi:acetoin utilization deacetylase AcuC-like enzyme